MVGSVHRVQPERPDPVGVNLDDLPTEPALWGLDIVERFGGAPDLQVTGIPAITRPKVVHNESHPGAGGNIAVL